MRISRTVWLPAAAIVAISLVTAGAQGRTKHLRASLSGAQEVPAVSSTGHGTFVAEIDSSDSSFTYALSYDDLEGTVTQAHIHLAQAGVNGGIMIWLCGTAALPGPAGTPVCLSPGGTVTGIVNASTVVGPAGQGIAPGEWEEALAALRSGIAYANVHSTRNPGGEIRGQINTPANR
jgi:hypothetical protein